MLIKYTEYRAHHQRDRWDARCSTLESMLLHTPYGYARKTTPILGQVDLAGFFMHRDSFLKSGVFFSECKKAILLIYYLTLYQCIHYIMCCCVDGIINCYPHPQVILQATGHCIQVMELKTDI